MECSIPIITKREFALGLTKLGRFPLRGTLEITPRCNLKCVHCYVTHCDWPSNILTFEEICKLIDDAVAKGCLHVALTGGEPLLRPDFIDIFTYAKKKGLLVTLLTNGTLLTPAIADFFMKYSPKTIDLSLYGATRETYEKITGVPGSYEKCINGIEMLVQRRIPLKLKSVVLTVNKHEIGQIQEYAHKLGLPFRFDPNIMPRLDHGGEPIDYRLSPEETYELEQQFRESREAVGDFYRKFAGPRRSDLSYICKGGDYSFFVDSYGRLSVCISSRTPNYDLRHGSFAEAFYDFIPQVKARKARPNSKCQKCELIAVCGRCPATAELETGDPDAEVEWLCRLAHLKASKYLIKTK